jgi:hypothetical protein
MWAAWANRLGREKISCIFCGAAGANVKIVREHTFSDWINEVLSPEIMSPDINRERNILHPPSYGRSANAKKHHKT